MYRPIYKAVCARPPARPGQTGNVGQEGGREQKDVGKGERGDGEGRAVRAAGRVG